VVDISSKVLKEIQLHFDRINKDCLSIKKDPKIPYKVKSIKLSHVAYEDFLTLCKQRKSVRWFLNKRIDPAIISKAADAARFAPSACNRQAFRLEVVDDPEFLRIVSKLPWGTQSFADNIPLMVFLIGDLSAYFDERDRHLIYLDSALFAMSFMISLETLGLSSCPLNWPDIDQYELELEKVFSLRKYERCTMAMAIGYPDPNGLVLSSQKKSVSQFISYNNVHTSR
jgi:nitroreductase